jgi:PAS domain-containing protein
MALIQNTAQPVWPVHGWGSPGRAERNLRDLSHLSLLVFAVAAVAAGVLAVVSLSSEFGLNFSWLFIVVGILFPLLCGLLTREIWRTRKLEAQIKGQEHAMGLVESALNSGDNTPAGLLIVSHDLRVQFANQKYLDSTFQEPEEILGWKIQDALSAEGLEAQATTLLAHSDPAASCCFDTLLRAGMAGERPVHITMTRISPRQGEGRVLVIIEDLLPGCSSRLGQPVEGYVC